MRRHKFVRSLISLIALLSMSICFVACDNSSENGYSDNSMSVRIYSPDEPFTNWGVSIVLKEFEYCDSFEDLHGDFHIAENGHEFFISKWQIQGDNEFIDSIEDNIIISMHYICENNGVYSDKKCNADASLTACMNMVNEPLSADKSINITIVHDFPCKVLGKRLSDSDEFSNDENVFFQHMTFDLDLKMDKISNCSETIVFGYAEQYYFRYAES